MRVLRLLPLLILTILTACASQRHRDPYAGGCVAADHEIASRAGAEVLARGGNAVDAAVATSFALSVVRPYSCGIGGGGFMVIHFSDEGMAAQRARGRDVPRSTAINYREMAPGAVTPDYYERDPDPHASTRGGKAVAIPGTVAGLLYALDRYGSLDRDAVLAPAIRAAEEGFEADAHYVSAARGLAGEFGANPDWKARFPFVWTRFLGEGKLRIGDRIHIPEQARALRLIAEHGLSGFYDGAVGKQIVGAVQHDRGLLVAGDLPSFRVVESAPLTAPIFGATIITMPPPSSGGLALLQTLLNFQHLIPARPTAHAGAIERWRQSPAYLHPLIECAKHAFADRARYLADPAFVRVPVNQLLARTGEFRDRYTPESTLPHDSYGTPGAGTPSGAEDGGTSHFSVVDAHGSAVACTETINLEFGSCIAIPEFGFVLNNEMDDFTTRRGRPNAFGLTQSDLNLPEPGKRPLSSMTPTIAYDKKGRVLAVLGASGGPRIISATTQCLLGALLNPSASSDAILRAARVHHQWSPDTLYFERSCWIVPDGTEAGKPQGQPMRRLAEETLRAYGHTIEVRENVAEVQMIRRRPDGSWDPACDPRKGGRPAGVSR